MGVQILTDSAADLPKSAIESLGIDVVPLRVLSDETEYLDGVTLDPNDLFRGLREGKVYKTSQPAFGDIYERLLQYARAGESCFYPAFSSELSGTYQTAVMALEQVRETYPEADIEILDTRCASLGQGLVAMESARMARQGADLAAIAARARFLAEHMEHVFTVDKLEYLVRGGRVSPVAAFIGGLLNIKPLLHVEAGRLIPLEKIRGRQKVLERMLALMEERGRELGKQTVAISHGDDPDTAEWLRARIVERFGCPDVVIGTIGASIGAHAGPGTIALFFLNKLPD